MWSEAIIWVTENAVPLFNGLTQVVGGFALLATLTPNTAKDDKIVEWILSVINFLGGNFGRASNSNT